MRMSIQEHLSFIATTLLEAIPLPFASEIRSQMRHCQLSTCCLYVCGYIVFRRGCSVSLWACHFTTLGDCRHNEWSGCPQKKEPTFLFLERPSRNGSTDNSLLFQSTIRLSRCPISGGYCIGNLTLTHARVTISAQDLDLWTVRVHGKGITQPIAPQMRDVVSCISTTTRDFRCYFNGGVIDQGRGCAELSARSLSSLFHIIVCLG